MEEIKHKISLRPYSQKDGEEIIQWCDTEDRFYKWNAGVFGDYPLTVERFTEVISKRSDDNNYFLFCAVDENGVVGFFVLGQPGDDRERLHFGFVILKPEVRGKGYGKQMLKLGLKYAFEVYRAKRVTLAVFENNPSAYFCYKSVGFWKTGVTRYYDIKGEKWNCLEMEITVPPMVFRKAESFEKNRILALYQSVSDSEFCTWDEKYPGMVDIEHDIRAGTLYVLVKGDTIVGSISVIPENELDDQPFWSYREGVREIARVAVSLEYQGRGIASLLLEKAEAELLTANCCGVHLLVACRNLPAYKTYIKAGYQVRGKCSMYGNTYYACEKKL